MRLKCVALIPDDEKAQFIKSYYHSGRTVYPVEVGRKYLVFGLTFPKDSTPWVEILDQSETYTYSVPLFLFEIVDDTISKYWVAKFDEKMTFFLWPRSFYQPYYHDDLSEGVPEIVEDFQRVKKLILAEAQNEDPSREENADE